MDYNLSNPKCIEALKNQEGYKLVSESKTHLITKKVNEDENKTN